MEASQRERRRALERRGLGRYEPVAGDALRGAENEIVRGEAILGGRVAIRIAIGAGWARTRGRRRKTKTNNSLGQGNINSVFRLVSLVAAGRLPNQCRN